MRLWLLETDSCLCGGGGRCRRLCHDLIILSRIRILRFWRDRYSSTTSPSSTDYCRRRRNCRRRRSRPHLLVLVHELEAEDVLALLARAARRRVLVAAARAHLLAALARALDLGLLLAEDVAAVRALGEGGGDRAPARRALLGARHAVALLRVGQAYRRGRGGRGAHSADVDVDIGSQLLLMLLLLFG